MPTTIIAREAQARCYECGAPGVAQVCHHCGVAICAEHARLPSELVRWLLRHEFASLPLPDTLRAAQPAHCDDCAHRIGEPSRYVLAAGAALALLGGLLALWRPSAAAALLALFGLAVVAGTVVLRWRRTAARHRLPMPLLPRIGVLKVRETVEATVSLDASGSYQIAQQPTTGTIELLGRLQGSERRRLDAYRKHFALPAAQGAPYHAGFLVLRGQAALRFTSLGSAEQTATNIIALTGDTSTFALLAGSPALESELFTAPCGYRVCEPLKPMPLPINLVPSLFQEADQHALALDLQWNAPRQWNEKPLVIERVLLLRVDVPTSWGDIEEASNGALTDDPRNGWQRIEWSQLDLDPEHPNWKRNCRRFSLRFQNQIDCNDTIKARAEVQFQGALSGLSGADLFSPLGTLHKDNLGKPATLVAIDFSLSLANVRFQKTRVVPDFKRPEDQQQGRMPVNTYPDIVPNHTTMTALAEALNKRKLYLKRIIENPPRVGEHAGQRNIYWDIAGREYSGVYPIDFHIVLRGEEGYRGRARTPSHSTHAELTVQGAYANPQMEAKIAKLWDELHAIIDKELGARSRAAQAAAAAASGAAHRAAAGNGAANAQAPAPAINSATGGPAPAPVSNGAATTSGAATNQAPNGAAYQRLHELLNAWQQGNHTQPVQSELNLLLHTIGITPGEHPLHEKEVGGGVR